MPLESLKLPPTLHRNLKRKTSALKRKIFNDADKIDGRCELGFCMYIQTVPKGQFNAYSFGKPEGIRAFIQSGITVIAATDFLFAGKNLRLSYIYQGKGLRVLVSALNKLEKKYSRDKEVYNAELIYFFLASGPYLLIKSKRKKQFYYTTSKEVIPISYENLRKKITTTLLRHKKQSKPNSNHHA